MAGSLLCLCCGLVLFWFICITYGNMCSWYIIFQTLDQTMKHFHYVHNLKLWALCWYRTEVGPKTTTKEQTQDNFDLVVITIHASNQLLYHSILKTSRICMLFVFHYFGILFVSPPCNVHNENVVIFLFLFSRFINAFDMNIFGYSVLINICILLQ